MDQTENSLLMTRNFTPNDPNIGSLCDWFIIGRTIRGKPDQQPKTVFVKAEPGHLELFFKKYLPKIKPSTRFILITGSSDLTLPQQIDKRYPPYKGITSHIISKLRDDKRIIHWYAENCDTLDARLSLIPLGIVNTARNKLFREQMEKPFSTISFKKRKLKALLVHRNRNGPQWEKRKIVTNLAQTSWSNCVEYRTNIPVQQFIKQICEYTFIICVTGGGLDPSPKVWDAILAGVIPIIASGPTDQAYLTLPLVIVSEWNEKAITDELLHTWLSILRKYYEVPILRRKVLERLSMKYWWKGIQTGRPIKAWNARPFGIRNTF